MEQKKIRVSCVGDSITRGTSGKSYPEYLASILGEDYEVMNFGVGGTTAKTDGYMRLPEVDGYNFAYVNQAEYKAGLESNPDIVLIMFGTNDSKLHNWYRDYDYKNPDKKCVDSKADDFYNDYRKLIEQYINISSKPRVIVGTTCIIFGDWDTEDRILIGDHILGEVMQNEVLPVEKKIINDLGLELVDINDVTMRLKQEGVEQSADGLHPDYVYDKLAEAFAKAILK